eukprot:PhF_6_TR11744/c0_g1_i1/m.19206
MILRSVISSSGPRPRAIPLPGDIKIYVCFFMFLFFLTSKQKKLTPQTISMSSTKEVTEKRPPSPDAAVFQRYQEHYKWRPEDPRWTPHDAPKAFTNWDYTYLKGGNPNCPHEYPTENTWAIPKDSRPERQEKVCIHCGLIVGLYDDYLH